MQVHLTLRQRGAPDRDLAIDAPHGATLAALEAAAGDALGSAMSPSRSGWWSGTRRLGPGAVIGGRGLRDGDIIGVGQVGCRAPDAGAVLRVHAIGGPDSGGLWALPSGLLIIGRARDADVRLTDGDASRRHASLAVTSAGVRLRDLDSTNGTHLDGTAIDPDGVLLQPDQPVRVGGTILCLAATADPPAALRPDQQGRLMVNRPPRASGASPIPAVEYPAEPARRTLSPPRIAAAIAPALVGAAMAVILHSPTFLLLSALTPIAALAAWAGDRASARRGRRRDGRSFRREEAAAEARCAQLLADEAVLRRRAHPDPAAVRLIARGPSSRLWERRRGDEDFLDVRIGLGESPARLALQRGGAPMPPRTLTLVPLHTNLRAGALGICGPAMAGLAAARWAIIQLAALHSPADLRIVALVGDSRAERWRWLRWLPHTVAIAVDPPSRRAAVQQLRDAADAAASRRRDGGPSSSGPWTVILIDRAGELADLPGLSRLLHDGPTASITAVCLDDVRAGLPAACATIAELAAAATHAHVRGALDPDGRDALPDGIRLDHAEEAARALAALSDPADERTAIPREARLADVLGSGAFEPAAFARRWAASAGAPRTAIGIGSRGALEVDLVRDGPHALIAGTTGAGKSELLQTLVAGLAAYCSPDDLTFVLIDYKGGAAFAQCADLPHAAGVVTDLDQALAERALRSLHAELRRREAILAAAGAPDLLAYRARAGREPADGAGPRALPRIVVVVDEFAALAEELPSFVSGLVGVAQRGRSLGIHLVLATQRPGGAVSPEIRANTNLRIALRVTDPAESRDIVGVEDAARLPRQLPGRAIVHAGTSDEPPVEIQVLHAAAPPRPDGAATVSWLDGWRRAAAPRQRATGPTDLLQLVQGARAAAAGLAPPRPPWHPPLPEVLALPEARAVDEPASPPSGGGAPGHASAVLGRIDQPDAQRQPKLAVDLSGGTTLIVGAARSGRTSALRLVAHQTGDDPVAEIHALDGASGALRALAASDRCGVFADPDDPEALRGAVDRLGEVLAQRRAQPPRGACVLLIDQVELVAAALEAADPGRGSDRLLSLLRDAPSGGMTIVATGDRGALAGRLGSAFATRILLRLNDPADYALAGVPARLAPVAAGAGRGVLAPSGDAVQLAVLDPDAAAQDRMLAESLARPRDPLAAAMPRLRALPRRIALSELRGGAEGRGAAGPADGPMRPGRRDARQSGDVLLGVGGDDAHPIALPLLTPRAARLLIAGPAGGGGSSLLASIAGQLAVRAVPTLLIADAHRQGPSIRASAELDWRADPPAALADVGDPRVILVDDCHRLGSADLAAWVEEIIASRPEVAVIAAGRTDEIAASFRGIGSLLARSRHGVLLCPVPTDADLFHLRLPRIRTRFTPGRGIYVRSGGHVPIQLAAP